MTAAFRILVVLLPLLLPYAQATEPTMYTYFERIPLEERYTDMTDQDDDALLQQWQSAWKTAGWNPIVLGVDDAKKSVKYYSEYEAAIAELRLDAFGQALFRRYIAMSVLPGDAWMCDYDVFPLRDFRDHKFSDDRFTIYDVVSATLAYSKDWEVVLQALLDDAKLHVNANVNQLNYWTDTLGMFALLRNESFPMVSHRLVMPAQFLLSQPLTDDAYCKERKFRKQFVALHVSPRAMIEGTNLSADRRRPKYRGEVGLQMAGQYSKLCNVTLKES